MLPEPFVVAVGAIPPMNAAIFVGTHRSLPMPTVSPTAVAFNGDISVALVSLAPRCFPSLGELLCCCGGVACMLPEPFVAAPEAIPPMNAVIFVGTHRSLLMLGVSWAVGVKGDVSVAVSLPCLNGSPMLAGAADTLAFEDMMSHCAQLHTS
jgi:hypothetical protein